MAIKIVRGVSGRVYAGKSSFVRAVQEYLGGGEIVAHLTSAAIMNRGPDSPRGELRDIIHGLGPEFFAARMIEEIESRQTPIVFVDGLRWLDVIGVLQRAYPGFFCIWIEAPLNIRMERWRNIPNKIEGDENFLALEEYENRLYDFSAIKAGATVQITTDGTKEALLPKVKFLCDVYLRALL